MYTLNRRKLVTGIVGGAATIALGGNRALAEYVDLEGEETYVSKFTGATISVADSGMALSSKYESEGDTVEVVLLGNETSVTAISFIPAGTDPQQYIDEEADSLIEFYPAAEVAESGVVDDGGWVALGIATRTGRQRGVYVEIQSGAFPEYDLVVNFTADLDTLEDDFERLQRVTIEGFEPFLFMEESGLPTLTFPAMTIEGNSGEMGTSTSSRTSRGSESNSSSSSGRRGQSSNSTEADPYITAVSSHQAEFRQEFSEFMDAVLVFAEDDSTDADKQNAFSEMDRVADIWVGYSARAGEESAPSNLRDLETVYLDWADAIEELGNLWIGARNGAEEVSAMFDQLDVVITLDEDLDAALRAAGFRRSDTILGNRKHPVGARSRSLRGLYNVNQLRASI